VPAGSGRSSWTLPRASSSRRCWTTPARPGSRCDRRHRRCHHCHCHCHCHPFHRLCRHCWTLRQASSRQAAGPSQTLFAEQPRVRRHDACAGHGCSAAARARTTQGINMACAHRKHYRRPRQAHSRPRITRTLMPRHVPLGMNAPRASRSGMRAVHPRQESLQASQWPQAAARDAADASSRQANRHRDGSGARARRGLTCGHGCMHRSRSQRHQACTQRRRVGPQPATAAVRSGRPNSREH
jgi:hypothetical protein